MIYRVSVTGQSDGSCDTDIYLYFESLADAWAHVRTDHNYETDDGYWSWQSSYIESLPNETRSCEWLHEHASSPWIDA